MTAAVQFALVPNFTHLALSDDQLVEEALQHVLQVRSKSDEDKKIQDAITDKTGCITVGDLRKMTDHEWKSLDVPALCRIYLKYVVRQSARLKPGGSRSFLEVLQDDFNMGQPFDISQYDASITNLGAMGFSSDEALEALLITENKGIEKALELLFQPDKSIRAQKRQEAVLRIGKKVDSDKPAEAEAETGAVSSAELSSLRRQVEAERQRRQKMEIDQNAKEAKNRLASYMNYIKGLTAGEIITTSAFEQLQLYRKNENITDAEHEQTIRDLGWMMAQFDGMKKFDQKDKRDTECVVCLDKPKDHVIMNCMHLCLCEDCAPDFAKDDASCPLCSKKVRKVVRIFT